MRALFDGELPELVMFDLDGTLVDSVPDLARAVDQMLLALDRDAAGEDQVRAWVGNGAQMLVRRALAGQLVPADTHAESPADEDLFPIAYELFLAAYAQCNGRSSRLYPGVMILLEALHKAQVPMAIVTNKPHAFTEPLLQSLQIAGFFCQVVSGDSLSQKKPDPAQLNWVLDKQQVPAARSLFVGDSMHDVQAARAAGCPVICVSYGYNHGEPIALSRPDRVLDSLADLPV
ncbi:phosphoglycolate phosphatase [Nitrincola sp. MINF-07-Sa-05]|uniref:phosphoglycolate phosphatase n=1 Tax=Nitrincola salilacus TaxID=3400273 RepID=UPI00391829E8